MRRARVRTASALSSDRAATVAVPPARIGDINVCRAGGCRILQINTLRREVRCEIAGSRFGDDFDLCIGGNELIRYCDALVARYIDGGFAVEFIRLQHPDSREENVTGG